MSEKKTSIFKIIFIIAACAIAGFFGLIFIAAMAVGSQLPENKSFNEEVIKHTLSQDKLAIIDITGVIMPDKNNETIIEMIKAAAKDDQVKGIILNMDTPGGGVTATDVIYHEVQKLRNKGKKVITCMQSVAASGGYYLAAGSDYIVANKTTITGSIGVIISTWNGKDMLEKIGVKPQIYKSGRLKDGLSPSRNPTAEENAIFDGMVGEMFDSFAEIVAKGRNIPLEEVKASPIGDARIFTAQQALDLKLIDQLGYLEDAIAKLESLTSTQGATIIKYKNQPTVMEALMGADIREASESIKESMPKLPLSKGGFYYLTPGFY
ncbi:MAG: signal peptide peptidase SppA [Lentisphaeraceae bacterium]|nr:signal peptide peptidase SppA [Lentisphaeraceae bacterium]